MRKEIILALILVGTILISGCGTKEASNNVPFIEDAVIKELESQNEVRVSLMLRENDKMKEIMSRERTKSNRAEINEELMKSIDEVQSNVLSSLSDSEFRLITKSSLTPTLSGYITKEGLNKLKNNPLIERIALVRTTQASKTIKTENENEYDYSLNSLIIIFNGKDKSGVIASSNNVVFKDHFLGDIDNISNDMDEVENITISWYEILNGANLNIIYYEGYSNKKKNDVLEQLKGTLNDKWYVQKVENDLLDKLQQTKSQTGIVNVSKSNSSAGVEFDAVILEKFNNESWVHVLVRLKDNSGIVITGTREEKRELLRQRDEWFKPVMDEVLATVPKTEFREVNKHFNGFSGYITKKGFDILVNNPDVRQIIKSSEVGAQITE